MGQVNDILQLHKIASFMAADSDFWVTGKFQRLHLINLLFAQQRLASLEEAIDEHLRFDNSLVEGKTCAKPKRDAEDILADLPIAIKAYSMPNAR